LTTSRIDAADPISAAPTTNTSSRLFGEPGVPRVDTTRGVPGVGP
jgi:hypothetical protein